MVHGSLKLLQCGEMDLREIDYEDARFIEQAQLCTLTSFCVSFVEPLDSATN
jgi:hypothetical protein